MIDFPNSPTLNEEFTSGNRTWKWNGEVWNILSYGGDNLLSSSDYVRPTEWLTLPPADANEVRGLHAVFDATENYCAVFARTTDGSAYYVDWGDGTVNTVTSNTQASHNYNFANVALAGTTTLKGYKQALVRVYAGAGKTFLVMNFNQKVSTPASLPTYSSGWLDINFNLPNLATGNSFIIGGSTIRHAYLERVNIASWGAVTNLTNLFMNCLALQSLNETEWNMSAITNITNLFYIAYSIKQLDCSYWNTSLVTSFVNTFRAAYSLQKIKFPSSFVTSAATSLGTMFMDAKALSDCDVSNFNTSNVTDCNYMFAGCTALRTINVASWNMAKVTTISNMFGGCNSLEAIDISAWSLPLCTNATGLFNNCFGLQKLETCNFSAVTVSMGDFANACNQLKNVTLTGINQTCSFANCQMSSAALDTIYTNLSATGTGKTITVTGNYGTTGDNTAIAIAKGWTVTG